MLNTLRESAPATENSEADIPSTKLKLVYIIGGYPALTKTFIDREITFLRRWGVNVQVISIRHPPAQLSAEQKPLRQGVINLLPASWLSFIRGHIRFALLRPRVYFSTLLYVLTRNHPDAKSRLSTLMHFAEGVYAAHLLRYYPCDQIHAHFIDRAATLALVASRLIKVPYSLTAHANDIYVNPILLKEKLAGARFVATCTRYNEAYLSGLGLSELGHKLSCIYHGLDLRKYQPETHTPQGKPLLLAVGQLREKKGYAYLIKACRILKDRGYDFECQIVGDGPLRRELETQIRELLVEGTVTLCGSLPHEEVINKYKRSTLFVLPCILGADGDRDGIPNVILEAMAMQLPVVSTLHSGIPEVVGHGVTGLLVPPANEAALAEALAKLLDDPVCRRQFGQKGRQVVIENFDIEQNAKRLLLQFTT